MGVVTGKTLKYWQNSLEIPIDGVSSFDRAFTLIDTTDSSIASPGQSSEVTRAKTTLSFNTNLRAVMGSTITTGDLTAGSVYRVIAKDSVLASYTVGQLFTADGTEAMSATDSAALVGSVITGKTLAVSIASATYKCISANYDVQYGEYDETDTSVAAPNMASVTGRGKCTSQFTGLMYRETADLITNSSPSATDVVITFDTGTTVTGTALLHQMTISDTVNDVCKVTYNAEWIGFPVEVNIGYLTMATEQAFQIIYETGSSTNKEVTGNVVLVGKNVTADVNSVSKIAYKGTINGNITLAEYS